MAVIPTEAINYLADKKTKTAWSWQAVYGREHNVAFTVAKVMEQDVLDHIHDQITVAVAEGKPFHSFKRDLINKLGKSGWGNYQQKDENTGEIITRLSDSRLKKIYETNTTQAYHAGEWQSFVESKKTFPYLRYRLGTAFEHRPEHKAWDGLILPIDDPFWQTHMPMNGWGCKCWVEPMMKAEAEAIGISDSPTIEYHDWVNPKTGQHKKVPKGIDPSFEYNVGTHREQKHLDLLADKIESVAQHSPVRAKNALARLANHLLFRENPRLLTLSVLLNGEKVAFVGDELGNVASKLAMAKQADQFLRGLQGKPLTNRATGLDFVIGGKNRKKLGDNAHLSEIEHLAIARLPELVKNAVVIERHADNKHSNPNVRGIVRLFALMQVGSKDYGVKLTVKDYLFENGETRMNLHAIEVYRMSL